MQKVVNRRSIASVSVLALLVGVVGLSALQSTPVSAKPAAAAATTYSLTVSTTTKSSTHKKLKFNISSSRFAFSGSTPSESASVGVSAKGAIDTHTWTFRLSNSSLSYNSKTGKGSLKSGKQLKPYGAIKWKIKNSGKKHVSKCGQFKTISQPVKLTGSWKFDTRSKGSHKWGKVSRKGKVKGTIGYSTGDSTTCHTSFPQTCIAAVSFSAFHPIGNPNQFHQVSMSGSIRGKHSSLFASKSATLKKPKNAQRFDNVTLTGNYGKFSVSSGKATLKLSAIHGAVGSATLTGPTPTTSDRPCGPNLSHNQHNTNWNANYKNGSKPFSVKEQIEGALKLPNLTLSQFHASMSKSTVQH